MKITQNVLTEFKITFSFKFYRKGFSEEEKYEECNISYLVIQILQEKGLKLCTKVIQM